jgi:hypothetical protein
MAKYKSYDELSKIATEKYTRKTTAESYRGGLEKVAPPGKKPREERVTNYVAAVRGKGSVWLREWEAKMYE